MRTKSSKKLAKLLSILHEETTLDMNATYKIELPRNNSHKFMHVQTDRDVFIHRAEITACQPDIFASEVSAMGEMHSDLHNETRSSMMRRSLAKINLQPHDQSSLTNINEGDSIVSTAEEHLTTHFSIVNKQSEMKFKPKSTSSTTSLFGLIRKQTEKRSIAKKLPTEISTVTFNVDFASTPKKNLPRSSTPRPIQLRKSVKESKQQQCVPFSSTIISEQAPKVFNSLAKKCIPPPLLSSSSYQPSLAKNPKRARSSSCKQCCSLKPKRLSTKVTQKQQQLQRKSAVNVLDHVASQIRQPNYFKNFKFPIKYLPNKKSQDIDRLSSIDDHMAAYECSMKPVLKSCYSFGDYNVWIL